MARRHPLDERGPANKVGAIGRLIRGVRIPAALRGRFIGRGATGPGASDALELVRRTANDVVREVTGQRLCHDGTWTSPLTGTDAEAEFAAVAAGLIARGVAVTVRSEDLRLTPTDVSLTGSSVLVLRPRPFEPTGRVRLRPAVGASLGWDAHYALRVPGPGPTVFARIVLADGSLPRPVLELGCGAGSDAVALAAGRPVVGLDGSSYALDLARSAARSLPVDQRPRFAAADVTDAARLGRVLDEARGAEGGPLLVYCRGLFDALDAGRRDDVLAVLAGQGRRGDALAIEVGTAGVPDHLRGAVPPDADELAERLTDLGWTIRPVAGSDQNESACSTRTAAPARLIGRRLA